MAEGTLMRHDDGALIVDLRIVLTDDGDVETLRGGRVPPSPGPLVCLLARWRDACRTGTNQAA